LISKTTVLPGSPVIRKISLLKSPEIGSLSIFNIISPFCIPAFEAGLPSKTCITLFDCKRIPNFPRSFTSFWVSKFSISRFNFLIARAFAHTNNFIGIFHRLRSD
jgi:hypothetical protein